MTILLLFRQSILYEGIYRALQSEFPDVHFDLRDVNTTLSINYHEAYDYMIIDYDKLDNSDEFITKMNQANQKLILWIDQPSQKKWSALSQITLSGYFHPKMSQEEMFNGMQHILNGRTFITPLLTTDLLNLLSQTKVTNPASLPRLTPREWDVYQLLVEGYSNEQIAEALNLSPATVKNYISSIFKQVEAKDRTNAVLVALKNRWYII